MRRRLRECGPQTRGERGVEERGDGADQAQAASFQRPKILAMCSKHSRRSRSKQARPSSPEAKPARLGGRVCLSTSEGADKQTGEVAMLLFVRGSRREGEQRGEQIAEAESASGPKPIASAGFCSEAVADGDGELPAESEAARRVETIEEMAERASLVAASAVQLCERAVSGPVAMNCSSSQREGMSIDAWTLPLCSTARPNSTMASLARAP